MNIILEQNIESMFETLQPKLDESNIIRLEDEGLTKLLKCFLFLQQFAEKLVADFSYTYDQVLYSQYYWFVQFKNQYFSIVGYDGGMDQQAFQLIENLCNELDGNVDWELLEAIDTQGGPK